MRLVVSTPAVQRILAITGIDRLLDIYPGVTTALGSPDDSAVQSRLIPGGNTAATADTDGGAA
jgi:hypothetical protein